MGTNPHRTAELGDFVVAAFDAAARYSTDPQEVSRLATQAVANTLRRTRRRSIFVVAANRVHRGERLLWVLIQILDSPRIVLSN